MIACQRISTLAGALILLIDNQLANNPDIDSFAKLDLTRLRVLTSNTKQQAQRQEIPLENLNPTIESLEYFISKYEMPDALPEPEQTERDNWQCDKCGQSLDAYCACPTIFI